MSMSGVGDGLGVNVGNGVDVGGSGVAVGCGVDVGSGVGLRIAMTVSTGRIVGRVPGVFAGWGVEVSSGREVGAGLGGFAVAEGGTLVADGAEAGAGVALGPGPAVRVAPAEADAGVPLGCDNDVLGPSVAVGGVVRPGGPVMVRAASSLATESRIAGDSGSNVVSRGSAE